MKLMTTFDISTAQKNFASLFQSAQESEIEIIDGKASVILVSGKDWKNILETLHLSNIPEMKKSIQKGLKTPIDQCSSELNWE